MTKYNCLSFDGIDDTIETTDDVKLNTPAQTILLIAEVSKPTNAINFIVNYNNVAIIVYGTGAIKYELVTAGEDNKEAEGPTLTTTPEKAVIIGYRNSSDVLKIRYNGTDYGAAVVGDTTRTDAGKKHIGHSDSSLYWGGKVYLFAIWNRQLTDAEIDFLEANPYNPIPNGLVQFFDYSGIGGGSWADNTINALDGTISGATTVSENKVSVRNNANRR
jgi:hypothetical protein